MSDDKNTKKSVPVNPGEVDHPLLQKVSNDEIDLEIDLQRDDEIAAENPRTIFKNYSLLFTAGLLSVFVTGLLSVFIAGVSLLAAGVLLESVL